MVNVNANHFAIVWSTQMCHWNHTLMPEVKLTDISNALLRDSVVRISRGFILQIESRMCNQTFCNLFPSNDWKTWFSMQISDCMYKQTEWKKKLDVNEDLHANRVAWISNFLLGLKIASLMDFAGEKDGKIPIHSFKFKLTQDYLPGGKNRFCRNILIIIITRE